MLLDDILLVLVPTVIIAIAVIVILLYFIYTVVKPSEAHVVVTQGKGRKLYTSRPNERSSMERLPLEWGSPCHIYSVHQGKWIAEFIDDTFYTFYFLRGYIMARTRPVGKEIEPSPLASLLLFLWDKDYSVERKKKS